MKLLDAQVTGDHAMTNPITKPDTSQPEAETAPQLFDDWFDPIEAAVRDRARQFIEELIRGELDAVLARPRYGRSKAAGEEERTGVAGHRHGSRRRSLTGTFGPIEVAVPRARLNTAEGKTREWSLLCTYKIVRRSRSYSWPIGTVISANAMISAHRRPGSSGRLDRAMDFIAFEARPLRGT